MKGRQDIDDPQACPFERTAFSYEEAFSRNLGWLTEWEQQSLRSKRIAIAGMGGVGGAHLLTLARLGVGQFHIADFDRFELANFNRQAGAAVDTVGRPKVEVLAERARQINPELRLGIFDDGAREANLDAFLSGVDVYVDGLDFFALDIRRKLMARCAELGIWTIIAAPLGMGAAYVIFDPEGMSFEQWFRLEGLSQEQQYVNFLLGLAPSGFHRAYLVDPTRVDLRDQRGPSTAPACELCAGVASVEAVKIMLRRGRVKPVPYYHCFDPYLGRLAVKKLRGGNGNPVQRIKIAVARRLARRLSSQAAPRGVFELNTTEIERILDQARWAPSTDNCQPWRFRIVEPDTVMVTLTDQSAHDLYDYRNGETTLLAGGMLLESIRIAASVQGRDCHWRYESQSGHDHSIRVVLRKNDAIAVDPLASYLPLRSVDRRPYRRWRLTEEQRDLLTRAHGPYLQFEWYPGMRERWRLARLAARATAIRLASPEAYRIHQTILQWDGGPSETGIPAAASGLSWGTRGLTRWAMKDWRRMRALNHLGAKLVAAVQMDYLPGLSSAAFFAARIDPAHSAAAGPVERLLRAGEAIQRFWLTTTKLGLAIQPSMASLVFAHYGAHDPGFTSDAKVQRRSVELAREFASAGFDETVIFMGRIGISRRRASDVRSIRQPLKRLLVSETANIGTDVGR